jgi:kynureninase
MHQNVSVCESLLASCFEYKAPRNTIVYESLNFPTVMYVWEARKREGAVIREVASPDGMTVPTQAMLDAIDERTLLVPISHVLYKSSWLQDAKAIVEKAHAVGARVILDCYQSAGTVPFSLKELGVDFACGGSVKWLCGGPGAGWLYVRPDLREQFEPKITGWMAHAAPFDFTPSYRPAAGVSRFVCGTPPVLAMAALECGIDSVLAAEPLGGIAALRRKSLALTELFIQLVEARCAGHGLALQTPRDPSWRGSQASFSRDEGGYAIMQALIERGVIGDFRAPDLLRFGFTPLYTRFVDVWDAVEQLAQVLQTGQWREARFQTRAAVT